MGRAIVLLDVLVVDVVFSGGLTLVHFEALLVVGVGLRRGLGLVLVSHILALGQPGWVWLKVETQKLHFREKKRLLAPNESPKNNGFNLFTTILQKCKIGAK